MSVKRTLCVVAISFAQFVQWTYPVLISLLLVLGWRVAHAGPCTSEILRIEKAVNEPNSPYGPTAPDRLALNWTDSRRLLRSRAPSGKRTQITKQRSTGRVRWITKMIRNARRPS